MHAHPNATAGTVAGSGLGALLVWVLNLAGVDVPAEAAAAIAGALAGLVLLVGRRGLRGVLDLILHGNREA